MTEDRAERHKLYETAITALVNAKVAFASWDTWEEHYKLTDAYELICDLYNTSRAKELE